MRRDISLYVFALMISLMSLASCGTSEGNTGEQELPLFVKAETNTSPPVVTEQTINPIVMDSSITDDYLRGKFVPAKHADFIEVEIKHASRKGMFLRKDTYDAFLRMTETAKKDGVNFTIKSATRNFSAQKVIWEGKWNGTRLLEGKENAKKKYPVGKDRALKILEYSSMPGTSRHHWGTDFDLNAFTNSYFEKGKGLKEYEWLKAHAAEYGFCQPYTPKGTERPDGYNEEKWHWSYLPVALKLTQQYQLRLDNKLVRGFEGSETAAEIDVVGKYVLGISGTCL